VVHVSYDEYERPRVTCHAAGAGLVSEHETPPKEDPMRIFVAGATGAIGTRLVPLLVAEGHEVTGMTRSPDKADWIRSVGAEPAVADGLDEQAVGEAIAHARPEVIVHQMTAIGSLDMRNFERAFEQTNRLRTRGTDILLSAARAVGARRFVAQSFAAWPYAREGGPVKTEEDPLDPTPPKQIRTTTAAIRHLEAAVTGAEGIEGLALRYGGFYGPGTSIAPGGEQYEAIRKRRFPIVGNGGGVWSLIHIDDAATATAAAIERGAPGIYNIADDEPATVAEFLPVLAKAIGAKPPRRVPVWLARVLAGEHGVTAMTELRGASNAKAKRELGWQPRYASWREGFATLVAEESAPARGVPA
jgi:nucleoside-diphosphate-sugar epimerase